MQPGAVFILQSESHTVRVRRRREARSLRRRIGKSPRRQSDSPDCNRAARGSPHSVKPKFRSGWWCTVFILLMTQAASHLIPGPVIEKNTQPQVYITRHVYTTGRKPSRHMRSCMRCDEGFRRRECFLSLRLRVSAASFAVCVSISLPLFLFFVWRALEERVSPHGCHQRSMPTLR